MIKIICDKCNCVAVHFSSRLLNQTDVEKISAEYNLEFKNDLIREIYVCPSCGDMEEFIHILCK